MTSGAVRGWLPASLLLAVSAVFAPALAGDRVFYQRDLVGYFYPHVEVVRRLVAEGGWPSWNPFDAFGSPFYADPNFQLAYPPTWLALLLPAPSYFKLYALAHCWAAGLGASALARRLGASAGAGLVAGVAYCCGGPLLSSLSLFHHFAGAAWMPWVLVALLAALDSGTVAAGVVLGAVAGGQALAGSADLCFMTALAAVVLAADRLLAGRAEPTAAFGRLAKVVLLSVPYAAALASIQWLPTLDLLSVGSRGQLDPRTNLYWSLHPASLVDLVVPRLLSDLPLTAAARAALFESREPLLASLYVGVPASVLALLGLVAARRRAAAPALGLTFFLLAALGRFAPLCPLLLRLPLFGLFRYPTKYLVPASLFFALLAGLGAEAWLRDWRRRDVRRAVAVALMCLLVASAELLAARHADSPLGFVGGFASHEGAPAAALRLAGLRLQLSAGWFMLSAGLLLLRARPRFAVPTFWTLLAAFVVDLVLAGRGANLLAPAALLEHRPPALALMRGDDRVFSYPYPVAGLTERFVGGPAGWDKQAAWALGNLDRLRPPSGSGFGVRGSYDGDFSGLGARTLYPLGTILLQYEATPLGPLLLRMGNVRYVVSLHPGAFGLPEVGSVPSVYAAPVRVLEVPDPLPPAYVVDGVHAAAEPRSWEAMASPSFDPRREVVVAEGLAARAPTAGFRGQARIVTRRADLVVVEADLSGPGVLVLVEAWNRGWSVRVDGAPARLLRANSMFRGVSLPGGKHAAVFEYRVPWLRTGAALTSGALLAGAALAVRARRRSGVEAAATPP
jgi:hypothetical protein